MQFKRFDAAAPNWRARVFGARGVNPAQPLPQDLQTALPTDYTAQIPEPGGTRQPAIIEGAARALRQVHPLDGQRLSLLQRIFFKIGRHPQVLTNYRVEVGTNDVVVWPFNQARAYAFMVNTSAANTVWIAWDRAADVVNGVPLPPGGFFEPILSSISSLHAISSVAGQSLVVCEGFYFGD